MSQSTEKTQATFVNDGPKQIFTLKFLSNSLLASSISNMAGLFCGHPLDTIRVRMQMESRRITARQCAYEAVLKEGPLSLMKGVTQPILGAVPVCMITFAANDYSKERIQRSYPQMTEEKLTFLSGALAGFCSLAVLVPMELLKCRAQIKKDGTLSITQEVRDIMREQGARGLYRGFWASAWRDIPGWAVYFSAYTSMKVFGQQQIENSNLTVEQKKYSDVLWAINAGGTAGVISWVVSLPQDIIKAKQQCHEGPKALSIAEAYMMLIREGGVRRIFRGMGPTFARGYIVNMVTLPLYDAISQYLKESS